MLQRILLVTFLLWLSACGQSNPSPASEADNNAPVAQATEPVMGQPTATTISQPTELENSPLGEASPTIEATQPVEASPTRITEADEPTSEATQAAELSPTIVTSPTNEPPPDIRFDVNAITIGLEPVVSGLSAPVGVVNAGDGSGRLFVVEKGGRIRVIEQGQLVDTPLLNISDSVSGAYEQGLLGLAFEPGRPERFYINYTDRSGTTIIARYRVSDNPNVADAASAEVILRLEQPAGNHNGGNLLFGPDGYLWIGTGDGGAANDIFRNGQNSNTLLGAMLRLDVSSDNGYTIPPDNPFVAGGGAAEIWAFGLRNPWRYSFDRATDELWIADVGQNHWEEVHKAASHVAGLNYGWPILEGNHCFEQANCSRDGLLSPVTEYNHDFGCSITGGNVYRGNDFPQLQGGYFFSDFCSGLIWAIDATNQSFIEPTLLLESGLQISAFGEDEAGELYLTSFADGTLYRLVSK